VETAKSLTVRRRGVRHDDSPSGANVRPSFGVTLASVASTLLLLTPLSGVRSQSNGRVALRSVSVSHNGRLDPALSGRVVAFGHFVAYAPACWPIAQRVVCAVVVEGQSGGTVEGSLRIRTAAATSQGVDVAVAMLRQTNGAGTLEDVSSSCATCGVVRPNGLPRFGVRVFYATIAAPPMMRDSLALAVRFEASRSGSFSANEVTAPAERNDVAFPLVPMYRTERAAAADVIEAVPEWPAPMEQVAITLRPSSLSRFAVTAPGVALAGDLAAYVDGCDLQDGLQRCRVQLRNLSDVRDVHVSIIRADAYRMFGDVQHARALRLPSVTGAEAGSDAVALQLPPSASTAIEATFDAPTGVERLVSMVLYFQGPHGRDLGTVPRLQLRLPEPLPRR
jgi:hypothetical protein